MEQNSVVYYSAVHEKHAEFFARVHIFSPEVLKKILQETTADYFYFDKIRKRFTQLSSKFFCIAANNANAGAFYPKSMMFKNYLDVQVAAVVQENIPLEKSAVEDFLIEQGFRMKRISKVTEKIIFLSAG